MSENRLSVLQEENPWYKNGLRFKCTECGQCCTGSPGYVWVTEEEIKKIADHLGLRIDEFAPFLFNEQGRWTLRENPHNFDCVFLKENKCTIYPVRPKQCRTFPWWPSNLKSQQHWENTAKNCEGIRGDAPVVSYEEIQKQLKDR